MIFRVQSRSSIKFFKTTETNTDNNMHKRDASTQTAETHNKQSLSNENVFEREFDNLKNALEELKIKSKLIFLNYNVLRRRK
jgi:hypothetical protein